MAAIRDLVYGYLDHTQEEEFAQWAFGEGYSMKTAMELMTAWNDRHMNLYKLRPDRSIVDDLPILVELWKNKNE